MRWPHTRAPAPDVSVTRNDARDDATSDAINAQSAWRMTAMGRTPAHRPPDVSRGTTGVERRAASDVDHCAMRRQARMHAMDRILAQRPPMCHGRRPGYAGDRPIIAQCALADE